MSKDNANVARFLPLRAAEIPDASAVRAPVGRERDGTILYREKTFAELERDACATAAYFAANGIERGTRTLVMVKPGLDLIRVIFAFFKIGAIPVVIDPGMGMRHFLRCVEHTRPKAVVGIPLAVILSHLFRRAFASVRVRVFVGRNFERRLPLQGGFAAAETREDERAAILFTSGSTGAPKGVCYEHGMFDAQVRLIGGRFGIERGEVDLPMLPIFALFNPAFGMTTVVPEMNPSRPAAVDPARIVQAIQQNAVTNSFGSPVLWTKICRYCTENGVQLPSVRRVLMAGAAVSPHLMERFGPVIPNGEIFSPYGATESLPVSVISAAEVLGGTRVETDAGAGTCVGRVFPEMIVRIVEPVSSPPRCMEEVRVLGRGEIGEIVVAGPVVTREYDRLPEATAAAKVVDADGRFWHRMGDLGYLDDENHLWFCGRLAERVVTKDGPLYTDCCEAIFNRHPRVYRSALLGFGTPGRQTPAVAVEPEHGAFPLGKEAATAFQRELRALAEEHPHTAVIRRFFFVKRFPVDVRHNAKIHRLALARRLDARKG
ncbi:MAG: AMP-binding protein [Opitutales bacterium]|nr:AMP-binding protein [Opitutales bacterium]